MLEVKAGFEERYKSLLGAEGYAEFMLFNEKPLRRSIRVNTLKLSVESCLKRLGKDWRLSPVPWCSEGFYMEHRAGLRVDIGNTPEHQLGYYYVQEAASMIPALVLAPRPGEHILDLCAAPGSKATQIAAMMQGKGVLVANDFKAGRVAALGLNLQRCGVSNAILTTMHALRWRKPLFDRVLLDAPCSGTGTIRKSLKTLLIWNPSGITRLAAMQKKLITTAFRLLKAKGTLVYSTCSVEPEENEGVVNHLLEQFPEARLEGIELPLKGSPPIMEFGVVRYRAEISRCLRLWPQDNDTEGFFVAKIVRQNI